MTQPTNPLEPLLQPFVDRVVAELRKQLQEAPVIKPRLLTIEQTAQYLGRTPSAIQNMHRTGKLKSVELDGRVFFDVQYLDALIDQAKGE